MSDVKRYSWMDARNARVNGEARWFVGLSDYDRLETENKALREEIEELDSLRKRQSELLSQTAIAIRGPEPELTRYSHADIPLRVKTVVDELDALRSKVVVVPEKLPAQPFTTIDMGCKNYKAGWNACLVEIARINGKTVNYELVREASRLPVDGEKMTPERFRAVIELNHALLDAGKEDGNG